jgi:hypothetical protein
LLNDVSSTSPSTDTGGDCTTMFAGCVPSVAVPSGWSSAHPVTVKEKPTGGVLLA